MVEFTVQPYLIDQIEQAINDELASSDSSEAKSDFPAADPVMTKQVFMSDLQLGYKIGKGAYSTVHKVILDGKTLAFKSLTPATRNDPERFERAAVDLAMEGDALARLDHQNIIQLHGVCASGPVKSYSECDHGYFLILDLLEDTLSSRLEKIREKASNMMLQKLSIDNQERFLETALDIAKGMEYLHGQNMVLRDLKPDNVGFDASGTLKLFDLGFARHVSSLRESDIAGSPRYMAPEIALGKGGTAESDVYSFGILLWELCTLKKPFKRFNTIEKLQDSVHEGGYRPSLSKIRSLPMRDLISSCWDEDPSKRPTFSRIVKVLKIETVLNKGSSSGPGILGGLKKTKATSVSSGLKTSRSSGSFSKLFRYNAKSQRDFSTAANGNEKSLGTKNARFSTPSLSTKKNRSSSSLKNLLGLKNPKRSAASSLKPSAMTNATFSNADTPEDRDTKTFFLNAPLKV